MEVSASQSRLLALQQCEANMETRIYELESKKATEDVQADKKVMEKRERFEKNVYPEVTDKAEISEKAKSLAATSESNKLVNIADEPKVSSSQDLAMKKASQAYNVCK